MRQVVVFKDFNGKIYMTSQENYNSMVVNRNFCNEMIGFDNIDECAEYLVDNFGYVVFKIDELR